MRSAGPVLGKLLGRDHPVHENARGDPHDLVVKRAGKWLADKLHVGVRILRFVCIGRGRHLNAGGQEAAPPVCAVRDDSRWHIAGDQRTRRGGANVDVASAIQGKRCKSGDRLRENPGDPVAYAATPDIQFRYPQSRPR